MIDRQSFGQDLAVRPLPPRERAGRPRIKPGVEVELAPGREGSRPTAARQSIFLAAIRARSTDGIGMNEDVGVARRSRRRAANTSPEPLRTGHPETPGRPATRARRHPTSCKRPGRPRGGAAQIALAGSLLKPPRRRARRCDCDRPPALRAASWAIAPWQKRRSSTYKAKSPETSAPSRSLGSIATLSPNWSMTR